MMMSALANLCGLPYLLQMLKLKTPIIQENPGSCPQHKPIPEHCIRLLMLQPSSDSEADIHCSIVAETPQHGQYIALSYSWGMDLDGEASFSRKIIVEYDVSFALFEGRFILDQRVTAHSDKPLRVTRNLFEALRRIGHKSKTRCLWADAVCIDQTHDREGTIQVAKMTEVFASAAHVMAWLGEGRSQRELEDVFAAPSTGIGARETLKQEIF
ncbi:hypothetical protein K431DRAFT_28926 [Polychaeton citri CBS 116435]|uniref:Heterokaryon incompatibility domain-containing protein n=1 Tax=Polychaeton citri CBS 116435 TaxID=1314669 RepID=A0A9P4US75_9PEZI|nr:hypothetical protein K431DRAFT_28926 [Polychaeton citri CBS 116435]